MLGVKVDLKLRPSLYIWLNERCFDNFVGGHPHLSKSSLPEVRRTQSINLFL